MISNIVVVSDTHFGCQYALCPPRITLDGEGEYRPSPLQKKLWLLWRHFWDEFVPEATKGEDYILVHNGDIVDGFHHQASTLISINLADQHRIAMDVMTPLLKDPKMKGYYQIRGTEAHVGKSAQNEEKIAKELGAIGSGGLASRYDLWVEIGDGGTTKLIHFLHHVGSTGSQAYEATAVHKELVETYTECARWGQGIPDMIVRSHRHRYIKTEIATEGGMGSAVVTPCWQGKTPFVWKIPGARVSVPQFGGLVVRVAHGELFTRAMVRVPQRSPVVRP